MPAADLTDLIFGRLRVLRRSLSVSSARHALWVCLCSCGAKKDVAATHLKTGHTTSCGCALREFMSEVGKKNVLRINRCYNKKHKSYHYYGGSGITVCPRWLGADGFINFLKDMGLKPTPSYTIDRKRSDRPYCPSNCVWATRAAQNAHLCKRGTSPAFLRRQGAAAG